MKRRDLIRSAALAAAGTTVGLGGLSQFPRWAAAAGSAKLGAWSSGLGVPLDQSRWPLIPIHAVLLGDGRVLTYGTDGSGKQTGYFIYDVWDASAGLAPDAHLTLPNSTQTDVFCDAQIVLPQSGNVLLAGGDNWTGTSTTNTANNNSDIFSPGDNTLTRSGNMNRPRWYASPTTLPDGRTYIQGGSGGNDRPEVRDAGGTFRLLTGVDTSSLLYVYPRNRVAPDGRLFGYSDRAMYYVDPDANGGSGSPPPARAKPSDRPRRGGPPPPPYPPPQKPPRRRGPH